MAERGQAMDIDSRPVPPPHKFEPPRPWEISKLREIITASLNQFLDPIRQAVGEEVRSVLHDEQRTVSETVFGRGSRTRSLSITIR